MCVCSSTVQLDVSKRWSLAGMMAVILIVKAIVAFAEVRTSNALLKAFTILLLTIRLAAVAPLEMTLFTSFLFL
jgi:hypothetical protein